SQQVRFPGTTTPVPFNRIPAGQISPIAGKFLDIWPQSATPGRNAGTSELSFTLPSENALNRVNSRIDYQLSSTDQIFGVFHRQWGRSISYRGNLLVGPASQQIERSDDYAVTLGWSRTFTSNLLNNFRLAQMHRIGHRTNPGQGSTSASDFGLQGIPNCLSSVPDTADGTKCGTPGVSVSGFQGFSTGAVLYEPASTSTISDTVTTLKGRHSLKIGGEARRYAIDNYQPNGLASSFRFTGSRTGNAFADFMFGRHQRRFRPGPERDGLDARVELLRVRPGRFQDQPEPDAQSRSALAVRSVVPRTERRPCVFQSIHGGMGAVRRQRTGDDVRSIGEAVRAARGRRVEC